MLKNGNKIPIWQRIIIIFVLIAFTSISTFSFAATKSECAEVKIAINQKLSFERQAFDAKMVISNGLSSSALHDVNIELLFFDRNNQPVIATDDPNAAEGHFFYRTDSMSGINSLNGEGIIEANSEAEIHWLIIPTTGAAGDDSLGSIYYVGARVTYSLNGKVDVVEVIPDFIRVKPLPELTLDYFLPLDVYGDDPFTEEVEPSIPFTLGVRIQNDGLGTSVNTKIESAQIKIKDNKQGLLVDFKILASYVANHPISKNLLLDFEDIHSNTSKVGRWIMEASLSGQFTEFNATFTHDDNLGGALTSVIKAINTHTLVHDVKVDLPGRDDITDFLALDGDILRVYESEGIDTPVADRSVDALLDHNQNGGSLTFPPTPEFVYVKVVDPWLGQGTIDNVQRADGKLIPKENVWRSQNRNDDMSWTYFINLFDVDSIGEYTFSYSKPKPATTTLTGNVCNNWDKLCIDGLYVTLTALSEDNDETQPTETNTTVTYQQGHYEFTDVAPGLYSLNIEPFAISLTSHKDNQEYLFNKINAETITFYVKNDLSIEIISPLPVTLKSEVK